MRNHFINSFEKRQCLISVIMKTVQRFILRLTVERSGKVNRVSIADFFGDEEHESLTPSSFCAENSGMFCGPEFC